MFEIFHNVTISITKVMIWQTWQNVASMKKCNKISQF